MIKKILAATVLAAGCWAGAAQAAPTITTGFTAGGTGLPAGSNTVIVQDFNALAVGTSIGTNASVYSTTVTNTDVRPTGATGNFAAVLAGGSYTISSFAPTSLFSFVIGTIDSFDNLVLTFSDGSSTTLAGSAITAGLSPANSSPNSDGLVTYSFGSSALLTSATFSASQNAFEFDTIAAGVPEPAAWGMMILGFGLIGGVLRRRSPTTVRFA